MPNFHVCAGDTKNWTTNTLHTDPPWSHMFGFFFLYFVAAYADFIKTYQKPWHKESFWTRKENISHLLYLICIKFSVNCQLRSIALDQRCLIISFSFIRDPVPLTRLMAWILSFSPCQRICSLR